MKKITTIIPVYKLEIDEVLSYSIQREDLEVALGKIMGRMGSGVVYSAYEAMVDNFDEKQNAVSVARCLGKFLEACGIASGDGTI